jgi:hypothetical protein
MPVDPAIVAQFLVNACPDHHVRDGSSHVVVRQVAETILRRHPEIARASPQAAIVCGDVREVERILRERPAAATEPCGPKGSAAAQGTHMVVDVTSPEKPLWEPLHYLCFTRLRHAASNDNAVAIARLLLDHGANPTAHFMAGGSSYTPLVGVVGAGEEGRAAHPKHDELARLLLEHGADPFDGQVHYNLHFSRNTLWFLKLAYEFSAKQGRKALWDDPEWRMIDMGGYGGGARWYLGFALEHRNLELAEWLLAHGASPNPARPRDRRMRSKHSLHEVATQSGFAEFADLLVRYGAEPGKKRADDEAAFIAACLRLDRAGAEDALARHPKLLRSPRALHLATELDRTHVVTLLLDLGVPIELANKHKQRVLHVAAWRGAMRVAALLIARGAEIDPRESQWSNTPLDFAVHGYDEQMIDLLAPHSRDIWNLVFTGKVARVREVLATDPGIAKTVSKGGYTPLMWLPADERAAMEIVELFLAHGVDATVRNKEGMTAEDWARKRWMGEVADRLKAGS